LPCREARGNPFDTLIEVDAGSTLDLQATTISGGNLTVDSTGQLQITGVATLDDVIVDDDTTSTTAAGIDVVAMLTLNDGTQIIGGGTGTPTVASTGELQITAGAGTDSATAGASISPVAIAAAMMDAPITSAVRLVYIGMFVEIVVWRVPKALRGSTHHFKYRLVFIVDGDCVLVAPSNSRPPMSHRKTDLGIPRRSKSAKVVLVGQNTTP
jgi:hypothetical protein